MPTFISRSQFQEAKALLDQYSILTGKLAVINNLDSWYISGFSYDQPAQVAARDALVNYYTTQQFTIAGQLATYNVDVTMP